MLETVFDKAGEHMTETAHRASRVTSALGEAINDGIGLAKRTVKHGCDAAEELMEDAQLRMKRHPTETVVAAFAVGAAFGILIASTLRRK